MPKNIKTRDGITLRNVPDDISEEEIRARLATIRAGGSNQQDSLASPPRRGIGGLIDRYNDRPSVESSLPEQEGTFVDRFKDRWTPQAMAGSPLARFATGAATPLVGTLQLGTMAGDKIAEGLGYEGDTTEELTRALREFKQYQREGMDYPEQFDIEGLAGNIATGAAVASSIAPAQNILMRGAQNVATGAGLAATQPAMGEHPEQEKAAQMALGAVLGGVIPGSLSAGRFATDRLTASGIERSAGRLANEAAGSRKEAIIAALRNNQNPLSQGTAGEVAAPTGSAEFAALQKMAAKKADPSGFMDVSKGQDAARIAALRQVGGSADDLSTQQAKVNLLVGQLYQNAFAEATPVTTGLAKLLKDPFVEKAVRQTRDVVKSEGVRKGSTQYFHLVKKALDDMINTPPVAGGMAPTQQRAVVAVREKFITELGKANPVYDAARKQAAELYKPISQMQIAQSLEQKLSPALADQGSAAASQRAGVYAQALRDAPNTIKRATGFRGGNELSDIMEPEQLSILNKVGQDLARRADYEQLASAGTSKMEKMFGEMYADKAAPMLSRAMMMLNNILNRTAAGASDRGLRVLAQKMQNPQEMARLMESATAAERSQLQQWLQAAGAVEGGQAITGASSALDAAMDWN